MKLCNRVGTGIFLAVIDGIGCGNDAVEAGSRHRRPAMRVAYRARRGLVTVKSAAAADDASGRQVRRILTN
jgi:hypothetical protein